MAKHLSSKARARALDALGAMAKHDLSLTTASEQFKVAPRTVKRVGRGSRAIRKEGGRWTARATTKATIQRGVLTPDGWRRVRTWGFKDADLLREYAQAVRARDRTAIAKFRGKTITDARGRKHTLTTDLETLRRLDRAGELQPPPWAFGKTP